MGLIALVLAWLVNRVAFKEMLTTVQSISVPDKRLQIVNSLFRDITRLDQIQRAQAFQSKPVSYEVYLKESDSLRASMDKLRKLYAQDSVQLARIDKMKSLLKERDSLFIGYLKVREGLVNSKVFTRQLNSLAGLINRSSAEIDSTVVTTEQKYSTTTKISPEEEKREKGKGLFGRLFGKKKDRGEEQVVKEEVSITVDTLARASSDSVIHAMEKAVKTIEKRQKQTSTSFINREIELSNAGNILINQMLVVLQDVEKDVIRQVEIKNSKATNVVNLSAKRIEAITLAFILITAFFLYLIMSDISRSNAYREELEAAKNEAEYHSMAKQRFLSSMSHEIRTPLQSIIGYAEQIKDDQKPSKRNIDAIYHSSIHLLHIVNEVLDYSRIVSGKFKFTRTNFSIRKILEEVMVVMRPQAESKELRLELYSDIDDTDLVTGDSFRLKQILINLLGNAIKFTEHGEVSLMVSNKTIKRRSFFTFAVKDTGPGISEGHLKTIFNEFEQAGAVNASNANGTGLGLSIVKALAEGQGGSVEVESELGKGSCFTVKLRYRVAKEPSRLPSVQQASSKKFEGLVWIVDDDKFILELCCSLFDKYKIRHRCFDFPNDLLAEPIDKDLRVVLMDMRMPQMNGRELCRLLRKNLPPEVKIFALTAQALPEERKSILEQGFDGLLMKPFRESELLNLISAGITAPSEDARDAEKSVGEEIDLTYIEKMAFGDRNLIRRIVNRFEADTSSDMRELQHALERVEIGEVSLLLHRIAGRTSQIGGRALAARFRSEEIAVEKSGELNAGQIARIQGLIEELSRLKAAVTEKAETADPAEQQVQVADQER